VQVGIADVLSESVDESYIRNSFRSLISVIHRFNPNSGIVLVQITPIRRYLEDTFTNHDTRFQVWVDINESLAGLGPDPIELGSSDIRVTNLNNLIGDADGYLALDYGDGYHLDNDGRRYNAVILNSVIQ
jgi:hypothetical protein